MSRRGRSRHKKGRDFRSLTGGRGFSKHIHITRRGCRSSAARRQTLAMEQSMAVQLDRRGEVNPFVKTSRWGR